jgi:hypothetical protein
MTVIAADYGSPYLDLGISRRRLIKPSAIAIEFEDRRATQAEKGRKWAK